MITIYKVDTNKVEAFFTTPELAVQSLKVSFHKVARVVPNAVLTQVRVIYHDTTKSDITIGIKRVELLDRIEHL